MSRNGSGTYSLPANSWNPAVAGTEMDATDWNASASDLETALTESIASDGQTACTGSIPFAQGINVSNGGLKTYDAGGIHRLAIKTSSTYSADRILIVNVSNADRTVSLGGNVTFAGSIATSGGFPLTLTLAAATSVSMPTSGRLATLAGAESLTNKKLGSLTTNGLVTTSSGNGTLGVTAPGTGVLTALAVNVGSAGAFVTFNGALGTPSSGTVTNLTGTASININGTVGATTPNTGAFTTVTASGVISGTDTTQSTSTTTGALKTAGGLGVVKDVFVGGSNNIAGTDKTSSTTCTVVTGGTPVTAIAFGGSAPGIYLVRAQNTSESAGYEGGCIVLVTSVNVAVISQTYNGGYAITFSDSGTNLRITNAVGQDNKNYTITYKRTC